MKANSMCISCLLAQQEKKFRNFTDEERKSAYMQKLLKLLCERGREDSAPLLYEELMDLFREEWGLGDDFAEIKRKYNSLLLGKEEEIESRIRAAADPLNACIRYVCAANYIDFAALGNVSSDTFERLLQKAESEVVSKDEYLRFCSDLRSAKRLVYLTDNCGEIVLDKLFVKFIKELYPHISLCVIVRGGNVINDATMDDAREVGLCDIVPCIGNGDAAPGTVLHKISTEAHRLISEADVIISKGQGNFESLYGEGLNPYFLFMCKCELFVRRFGMKQYESEFCCDGRIKIVGKKS